MLQGFGYDLYVGFSGSSTTRAYFFCFEVEEPQILLKRVIFFSYSSVNF